MRNTRRAIALALIVFSAIAAVFAANSFAQNGESAKPPMPDKNPKVLKIHDQTLTDNYFWLRDKKNPKVIAHLEAENAYAESVMKPTAPLRDALYKEMISHIKETDENVPYRKGNYFYYSRTVKGLQYPIYARKHGSIQAREEITLDLNEMAKGLKYLGLGAYAVSDDGNYLAYSTDTTGYRQYTLQIKDLRTGELLPEKIERVGSVIWATDNKTLFYSTEDAVTKRSDKFFRHVIGTDQSVQIFEDKDELFDVYGERSRDKAVIFIASGSKTSTEYHSIPADKPTETPRVILPREKDHEYSVEHRKGMFYIRTNQGAKNFRVVTAPAADPRKSNWKELIPHRKEVKINGIDPFANHLVVSELETGLQQLRILDLRNNKSHRIEFPEPVYTAFVSMNMEFDTKVLRFGYQSLVTPNSTFDYDMVGKTRVLLKQTEVPGGFDRANYKSERIFATAADGTKIPISMVYRKGTKLDGKSPLLLYGYGSYGASMTPTFSSNRLSLLDRGVVYAIAHIRGGGEMGEEWRDAGRMMKKMNTFTDFIASAEHLIKQKYTASDRLVIQGGSAGGLLMGAVSNMRPDLFKAVVSQVPFVDVLNTMLDATLPLTTSEYIEWGNPNDKAAFDYIKSYSPYDNIAAKDYPTMLVKVSLNDSQVPYWEGAKLVAKLRDLKTDKNPLLLKVNMGAGHGGSSGRYDALKEIAFDYAFMLWQMGLVQNSGGAGPGK